MRNVGSHPINCIFRESQSPELACESARINCVEISHTTHFFLKFDLIMSISFIAAVKVPQKAELISPEHTDTLEICI